MADFVGLLKKAIAAQNNATLELRQRIYNRARETIEKKLTSTDLAPELIELQRRTLEKAIDEVEESYHDEPVQGFKEHQIQSDFLLKNDKESKIENSCIKSDSDQEIFFPSSESPSFDSKTQKKSSEQIDLLRHDMSFSEKAEKRRKNPVVTGDIISSRVPLQSIAMEQKIEQEANYIRNRKIPEARFELEANKSSSNEENDDFSVLSSLFARTLIQERKRSLKKQFLLVGVISIVVLCISMIVSRSLIGFLLQKKTVLYSSGNLVKKEHSEKITQRLMQKDQGTNPELFEEKGTIVEEINKTMASYPLEQPAKAVFYEAQTSALSKTMEIGSVKWSLLHEKREDNREEMIIRGDVSIPDKALKLRMTIRSNNDLSIPATHLVELIFMLPEDFDGGAIDHVSQLLFKASEQSIGEELRGVVPFKINDNSFVLAMNAPKVFLRRNLDIMRQLPWMELNIAYKTGRLATFSIAKGHFGDVIFKQVLDNWHSD